MQRHAHSGQSAQNKTLTDYARTENFETGEVGVHWRDGATAFTRDLFVSRADNLIVMRLGAKGKGKAQRPSHR